MWCLSSFSSFTLGLVWCLSSFNSFNSGLKALGLGVGLLDHRGDASLGNWCST